MFGSPPRWRKSRWKKDAGGLTFSRRPTTENVRRYIDFAAANAFDAWGGDGANTPEHETILFFTRLLAGRWTSRPASSTCSWSGVPLPVTITTPPVTWATRLRLILAPGGGQAIRIRPAE